MNNLEFPHTAVICAPTEEDARELFDLFAANDFRIVGENTPIVDGGNTRWINNKEATCYDIEGKAVCWANREYYETRFGDEFPRLIPDDPKWFLCTVQDFIDMCGGKIINAEFDIAEEGALEAMLRG